MTDSKEFETAPGKKTSEFLAMIVSTLVALLVAFNVIRAEASVEITNSVNVLIQSVTALIATVGPAIVYIISRTWLKAKAGKELKKDSTQ